MDESQQSRVSDAAAIRKRRSSILKSQRPSRAPLSELEFNVTTPTDTTKSRRVSFSRRTGVAEFVTHEATTTWKNFYEEHNKSLESSGNESAAHPPKPSVGHLGKQIFEDQFQEVEAIDFGSTQNNVLGINSSISNVKFDQLALECIEDDKKNSMCGQNFEFSQFTVSEQPSKLFGDDLAISGLGEVTDKINVNFSSVQSVGDDLEEIEKDLERMQQANTQNIVCAGPLDAQDSSGYIEIDLNITHVALGQSACSEDMSITDTIHSPKVNVSNTNSTSVNSKLAEKDWVVDKENIAVNPYIAPKESEIFAINENPEQVLVFDGKRLTVQLEKQPVPDYREDLVPSAQPPVPTQRKTIVLNVDDDLPNFVENAHSSMYQYSSNMSNKTLLGDDCDISMTQVVSGKIETEASKHQTIIFEDTSGGISMTQALPIYIDQSEKRKTIVFDNEAADISVTQAVPTNLIVSEQVPEKDNDAHSDKRKTIIFDDDSGNISITQALPTNLLSGDRKPVLKKRTIMYETDTDKIDVTQLLQVKDSDKKSDKRNTLVFDNDDGDISMTKAIPHNIILNNKVESNKEPDSEKTETISTLPLKQEKRKTIVFDDHDGDISITKTIPSTIILPNKQESGQSQIEHTDEVFKRYEDKKLREENNLMQKKQYSSTRISRRSRISITYDNDMDISMTEALPSNILIPEKDISNSDKNYKKPNMMMTENKIENIMNNIEHILEEAETKAKPELENIRPSVSVPDKLILPKVDIKRDSLICDDNMCVPNILQKQISFDTAIHDKIILLEMEVERTNIIYEDDKTTMAKSLSKQITFETVPSELEKNALNTKLKTFTNDKVNKDLCSVATYKEKNTLDDGETAFNKSETKDDTMTKFAINMPGRAPEKTAEETKEFTSYDKEYRESESLSLTTVTPETVDKSDATQIDIIMTESAALAEIRQLDNSKTNSEGINESKHSYILKGFSINNKVLSETTEKLLTQVQKNTLPIPKNLIDLQKSLLNDSCLKKGHDESNYLKDMLVYQTMAAAGMRSDILEPKTVSSSMLSSSEGMDLETKPVTDNDKVVNAEFVTVKHKLQLQIPRVGPNINDTDDDKDLRHSSSTVQSDIQVSHMEILSSASVPTQINIEQPIQTVVLKNSDYESQLSGESKNSELDKHYQLTQSESTVDKIQKTIEKSILDDLLDMDSAPEAESLADKSVTAQIEPKEGSISSESMFFITKDSNNETQTEKSEDEQIVVKKPVEQEVKSQVISPLQKEFENCVEDLEKKILELHKRADSNREFERQLSPENRDLPNITRKSYRDANSTKELLDMLSKFTEKEEEHNPILPIANDSKSIMSRNDLPERIGFSRRQSLALSRDDLMNNISMAQAMLQKSCETELMEDSDIDSTDITDVPKNTHLSNDVIKTLRFEDDDYVTKDIDDIPTVIGTPLKKTAFGETSYMTDDFKKGRVIPTYLKDVSDGIKSLMTDLVKPMTDVMPFDNGANREPTKRAKQIQANLITSSQIDLAEDLSDETIVKKVARKIKSIMKSYGNSSPTETSVLDLSSEASPEEVEPHLDEPGTSAHFEKKDPYPTPVIKFDPYNPLNNILIAPPRYGEIHTYTPNKPVISTNRYFNVSFKDEDTEEEKLSSMPSEDRISTQFNIQRVIPYLTPMKEELKSDENSHTYSIKKPSSISQSVETVPKDTTDAVTNTLIAMQDNKQLLQDASSLTLVESTAQKVENDVLPNLSENTSLSSFVKKCPNDSLQSLDDYSSTQSPKNTSNQNINRLIEVIYNQMSNNTTDKMKMQTKVDKRTHSKCTLSSLDVTPKSDPKRYRRSMSPASKSESKSDKSPKHLKERKRKMGTNIIVHSLTAEYDREKGYMKMNDVDPVMADSINMMVDKAQGSCGSKNNAATSFSSSSTVSMAPRLGWQPELLNEVSSNNQVTEQNSEDIIKSISLMPFMGSSECECESCDANVWSFLLLHGRLRLVVTLHCDPGTGRSVTPRTAITGLRVEHTQRGEKNAAAILCVKFAMAAMRQEVARTDGCASVLPALLQRCAAIARLALRWGRAMHDAWLRLAYTLTPEGYLTLKVANVPLRCVWEVSMTIDLAMDGDVPWPRANNLRIHEVVTATRVSPSAQLQRTLARLATDWGHVPRTVWKVFKYLKNKQPESTICVS